MLTEAYGNLITSKVSSTETDVVSACSFGKFGGGDSEVSNERKLLR